MSIWSSDCKDVMEDTRQIMQDFSKKSYTKIDPIGKLQVIHALDNGQCKADIAREYGVHPQTIAYIYKQKESIIKKYTQKYNLLKEVRCINLDQTLLDWLEIQIRSGNVVTEEQLRNKAKDVMKTLRGGFNCIDDWLLDFRIRHNIAKYTPDVECSKPIKEEWMTLIHKLDVKDIYVCGVCALAHSLDFNSYMNGQNMDDYLSLLFVVNILGTDKKELAVVGKNLFEAEPNVGSLPVNYYHCDIPQVNYSVMVRYLEKWDLDLGGKGKSVTLLLNIPDTFMENIHFENIRLVSTKDMNYVTKIFEKIFQCFKCHYRKLQISKTIAYGKDYFPLTLLDYINLISMAWYNVPSRYIQRLCFPPQEGSLYFNTVDDFDGQHSLSQWCKLYNIPLDFELHSNLLDKYVLCDKKLPYLYWGDNIPNVTEVLMQNNCQSTSGIEAYQAMKRLVTYLQGEGAGAAVIKYAKYLENHTEYGALLQMHQIIASTNDQI